MWLVLTIGILICCTGHFWNGSLCLFGFCVLVSSVSNFHPDTSGWRCLLFRFACSFVLRGGSSTADKCHWRVWGALTVFRPHWVCPGSWVCAFPVYTAQAPGCSTVSGPWVAYSSQASAAQVQVLHKDADSVGPAFCALPVLAAQGPRSLRSALSPRGVHLIPSAIPASVSACARSGVACVSSGKLDSSCDPSGGCQPSRISGSL